MPVFVKFCVFTIKENTDCKFGLHLKKPIPNSPFPQAWEKGRGWG